MLVEGGGLQEGMESLRGGRGVLDGRYVLSSAATYSIQFSVLLFMYGPADLREKQREKGKPDGIEQFNFYAKEFENLERVPKCVRPFMDEVTAFVDVSVCCRFGFVIFTVL